MNLSPRVREILAGYEGETPGTKANLARILMAGRVRPVGALHLRHKEKPSPRVTGERVAVV